MSTRTPSRRRAALFALLVAACAAAAAIAIVSAVRAGDGATKASAGARDVLSAARKSGQPMVVFRILDPHRANGDGQVAIAPLGTLGSRRTITPLSCARVYYSAAGAGLCLARGKGFAADSQAEVFGADLRIRHKIALPGVPSRARVSPDGRYGAVTLFVSGHSYATAGSFSTQTTIIDLARGRKIADLEDFVVTRGGRRVTAIDRNFWGITFARDSDSLYATLATGGKTYLVEGSISARSARVIHENVECPSVSPDGTRMAYKKRGPSSKEPWRLTVLDLATLAETPLAETRSVDDQVEWLDNDRVLYGVDGGVWTARADGRGQSTLFIAGADSPAVVRW